MKTSMVSNTDETVSPTRIKAGTKRRPLSNQSSPSAPKPVPKRRSNDVHLSQNINPNIITSPVIQSCISNSQPVHTRPGIKFVASHSTTQTYQQHGLRGFSIRMNPIEKFGQSPTIERDHVNHKENLHRNVPNAKVNFDRNNPPQDLFNPLGMPSPKTLSTHKLSAVTQNSVSRSSQTRIPLNDLNAFRNHTTHVSDTFNLPFNNVSTPSSRRLSNVNLEGVSCVTSNRTTSRMSNRSLDNRSTLFQLPASSILPRVNPRCNQASSSGCKNKNATTSSFSGTKNLLHSFNLTLGDIHI